MARAIDADALYDLVERRYKVSNGIEYRCERNLLDLICNMPTLTPPNEALTLNELRKMDGEPVYMTFPSDTGNQCGHWALVGTQRWGAVSLIYGCGWSSYESAVETLGAKFYRRPPEGEEHCYG